MIKCRHKHCMQATNLGVTVESCLLKHILTNDFICRNCDKWELDESKYELPEMDFPSRPNKRVQIIYFGCSKCPHFDQKYQNCKKADHSVPIDILARNPAFHCPEGLW